MDEVLVLRNNFITPPCSEACPAGVDVPRYIRAIRNNKFDEAVAVLREKLPLPVVCADACFAPCEEVCAYKQFGDPIAIRALKRAAVDMGGDLWKERRNTADPTGKSVAVVGAGPAGLTAADLLANKGHVVTIFDSFPKPGGMLRYGIPGYRLPAERLDRDINDILDLGVSFKGGVKIGRDMEFTDLKEKFNAVFIAAGASSSSKIHFEGSDKSGLFWGWDFLSVVGLSKTFDINGPVAVIGGGNVAMDAALTAKRLGADEVHLFCLEKREEMPTHEWEVTLAEDEGIEIHNSWAPKKVLGDQSVKALILAKCTSVFDETGAFNPTYDEDITLKIETGYIILAVGQKTDLAFLKEGGKIDLENGCIQVQEDEASTGEEGVFAGGDVVSGPESIISAIAHGRKAAAAIDIYLGGDGNINEDLAEPEDEVLISASLNPCELRNEMDMLKTWERGSGFDQVELGLSGEQVAAESGRCLECDARSFDVILNTEYCKECGYCSEVCGVGIFGSADTFNEKGYRPAEVKSSAWCVGCFKCYFACPDFAIDVKAVSQ